MKCVESIIKHMIFFEPTGEIGFEIFTCCFLCEKWRIFTEQLNIIFFGRLSPKVGCDLGSSQKSLEIYLSNVVLPRKMKIMMHSIRRCRQSPATLLRLCQQ
jgi:hypothetical protein